MNVREHPLYYSATTFIVLFIMEASSNAQSIYKELNATKDLYAHLAGICHTMSLIECNHRTFISSLEETGVAIEACKKYREEYHDKFRANMGIMRNNFIFKDVPFIRNVINSLCAQLRVIGFSIDFSDLRLPHIDGEKPAPKIPEFMALRQNKSQSQDLKVQLNACVQLLDFLKDSIDKIHYELYLYKKCCEHDLTDNGVPDQVAKRYYLSYAMPNIGLGNKTIADLEEGWAFIKNLYDVTFQTMVESNMYVYGINGPKPLSK